MFMQKATDTEFAIAKKMCTTIGPSLVKPMSDALMGEEVLAFVALKPGIEVSADDIIGFCQSRLAKFKSPKQVRFVDALPKSPVGKILRKELRMQAG